MVRWTLLVVYVLTFVSFALVAAGYLLSLAHREATAAPERALYAGGAAVLAYIALTLIPRWYRMGSYRIDGAGLSFHQPHVTRHVPWAAVQGIDVGTDAGLAHRRHHRVTIDVPVMVIETGRKTYRLPFGATAGGVALFRLMRRAAAADRPAEVIREHLASHGRPASRIHRWLRLGWHLAWLAAAVALVLHALAVD